GSHAEGARRRGTERHADLAVAPVIADKHGVRRIGVETRNVGFTRDFAEYILEFAVKNTAVSAEGTRSGLSCQDCGAVEQIRDVVQSAVGNLKFAQTVVGVTNADGQNRNVRTILVRDRQTCGIVAGTVDAQTARQTP